MTLTRAQQDAIRRSGQDVCVVAGPGSGKTSVLIERFAWLVEECGVRPTRILAVTFTEKAANEIKERLMTRFAARPDLRDERAWVSTIHGFCARLLQENAIAAGIAPDFTVLDQAPAERLARDAAEEALDGLFRERPGDMRRLIQALDLSTEDEGRKPDLARSLLDVYDAMRLSGAPDLPEPKSPADDFPLAFGLARDILAEDVNRGAHAPQLREWAAQFLSLPPDRLTRHHFVVLESLARVNLNRVAKNSRARAAASDLKNEIIPRLQMQWLAVWNADLIELLRTAVSRIGALYREKRRRESTLDFADLEQEAIHLLESNDTVRRETSARFDHLLMDELQDTNRLQWRLVTLIQRNLFAVGDVNQSIYGFRHADPTVFEDYRRTLQTAGATIDDLPENHRSRREILEAVSRALDGQIGIESRPFIATRCFSSPTTAVVERLVGQGDRATEIEAGLVAARVRELVDSEGYKYNDVAVLVRTLGCAQPFESAFDRFGIPFLVSGGGTFLETREVRDVLALLAALVNPLDDIAVVGVLRSPLAGISDEDLFRIGREGWGAEFAKLFGRLRPLAGFVAPDRLLVMALDESNYFAGLPDRARANLEKLFAYMRREHRRRARPLAETLEDLEALRAAHSEAEAPPQEAGNAVRLMTIHAAKGLEFPVVFVSALHRGPDRRKPVIAFSHAGLGARWRNPASGKLSDPTHAALIEEVKRKEQAEENRLFFVAMTRAEERLILSYAERSQPSAWQRLAEAAVPAATASDRDPAPPMRPTQAAKDSPSEELLSSPAIAGQYDSAAAVTSIALFDACPRKYYLSRYLGIEPGAKVLPSRDQRERSAIDFGLEVHRILAGEPGGSPEASEVAALFKSSEIGRRTARATRIEREFDFLFHIEDIVLRGQIDLWFEEGGELVLVDYKTDREARSEAYELQLRIYALALERYSGRIPNRAVLYYLRSNRLIEVSLEPHELHAVRDVVRAFLTAQESLEFPLAAGEQCRRCPFFAGLCPARLQ